MANINNGDTEGIIEEAGRGFLGYLTPADVPHCPYQGRDQFQSDFKHAANTIGKENEWLLVPGVSRAIFETHFRDATDPPFSRWAAYDQELEALLVRMTRSPAHEAASRTFNILLSDALGPMGLKYCLAQFGSATHFGDGGGKEADDAWRPRRVPPGRSLTWPSVVLEVGYSETKAKLRSDVRFWSRQSQDDVKVVLTLHVNKSSPQITIEQWEVNPRGQFGTTQQIVIKRNSGGICVSGAPLVIAFEKLFLRQATIPREQDVVLGQNELEILAEAVWNTQQF